MTVLDSICGGGNFIPDLLDSRADNDLKAKAKWWGKMDSSYAGTFFIGAHAMAGTQNAFLDHMQFDPLVQLLAQRPADRRTGAVGDLRGTSDSRC